MNVEDSLIEVIAEEQHNIWSHWMKYLFSVCSEADDGSMVIPKEKVTRWQRQMWTPYVDLTDAEKVSDRHQAIKVLPALNNIILALTDATERAEKSEAALADRDTLCEFQNEDNEDFSYIWNTACGGKYWLEDGTPDQHYKFCPSCGHPFVVRSFIQEVQP